MRRPDDDDEEDGMDTTSEIRRKGEKGQKDGKALDREPLRKSEDEKPVEKDRDSKDR
jgi:hypothetical protein